MSVPASAQPQTTLAPCMCTKRGFSHVESLDHIPGLNLRPIPDCDIFHPANLLSHDGARVDEHLDLMAENEHQFDRVTQLIYKIGFDLFDPDLALVDEEKPLSEEFKIGARTSWLKKIWEHQAAFEETVIRTFIAWRVKDLKRKGGGDEPEHEAVDAMINAIRILFTTFERLAQLIPPDDFDSETTRWYRQYALGRRANEGQNKEGESKSCSHNHMTKEESQKAVAEVCQWASCQLDKVRLGVGRYFLQECDRLLQKLEENEESSP